MSSYLCSTTLAFRAPKIFLWRKSLILLPRRGHFFAAQSAKKRRQLVGYYPCPMCSIGSAFRKLRRWFSAEKTMG